MHRGSCCRKALPRLATVGPDPFSIYVRRTIGRSSGGHDREGPPGGIGHIYSGKSFSNAGGMDL